jgi:hypothetical protein
MEFRWKIRSMLEKSRPPPINMGKLEHKAQKNLRLNKDIKILQADKGNCTVIMEEASILTFERNSKLRKLQGSSSHGIYRQFYQPTQFGILSHLDAIDFC